VAPKAPGEGSSGEGGRKWNLVNRALRLREEAEVREARARGKAYADGPLVARVLANGTDPARNRYAVIAGKRVGKAVQRNRCKRLAREAIRALHPRLLPGYDIVIIVRGTVEELTGLDVAQGSLERIAARAGLIRPDDGNVSAPGQAARAPK
jgi:ribonuclease P protein component